MATQYFFVSTKQAAFTQDADYWLKFIARAKRAQDFTELLFPVVTNPNNGESLILVSDAQYAALVPKLTGQQKTFLDSNLRPATDPKVVEILAAQPKSQI